MIISVVLAMFVLEYIGQVYGMAEMHLFFFTNMALLILYQDWRVIIPYTIVVVLHHSLLAFVQIYLGNSELSLYLIGYTNITFLQMAFHFGIVSLMSYIAILLSSMLQKNNTKLFEMQELTIRQNQQLLFSETQLQEALLNTEDEVKRQTIDLQRQTEELQEGKEELKQNLEELNTTQLQLQLQFGELSVKSKNITDSINYAKRIQTALLPRLSEIQRVFPESFVLFRPKDVISGDFYWFANKTECNLQILVAADCTGHGVPGAFMSMLGSSLLSNIVHDREIHEPNKILDLLHISIEEMLNQRQKDNTNRDGMDATICMIDRNKNCIYYSGANNSLYVISQNPLNFIVGGDETKKQIVVLETENWLLTELKADKKPIGGRVIKQDDFNYNFQTFELNQELRIYLSSDGFIDQIGGEDCKKLMSKNFKQLLIDNHEKSYEEQKDVFNDFFENWISYFDNKQLDDMMLLGVKV